jgi:multidrug resistance efflux pump
MDLLLVLTYTAICIVIFKVFKLPINKWTVPTAVLGGIFLIGALIFTMNYNHPYSEIGREYFVTTPIIPAVSGLVTSVPVQGNDRLKKGDVLFTIDSVPFENAVKVLLPQLALAEDDLERAIEIMERGVGKQRDVDAAQAQVDNLSAQLESAEYQLSQTTVRAPTDGYVTQVTTRPGLMAKNMPFRPAMIFVHDEGMYLTGWFRQNSLLRLKEGYEAEVAFDGIPGEVFTGKVRLVLPVIAEGQVLTSGTLISASQALQPGRIPVYIEITDPDFEPYADRIPGGAFAQIAIYSDHFHHVAIIRRVLLRMASWVNYLFPFH